MLTPGHHAPVPQLGRRKKKLITQFTCQPRPGGYGEMKIKRYRIENRVFGEMSNNYDRLCAYALGAKLGVEGKRENFLAITPVLSQQNSRDTRTFDCTVSR